MCGLLTNNPHQKFEREERERERERGGWGEGWDGEFGMGGGRGEQLNKLPNVGPQMF
jgi:hypothetical protein